VGDECGILSPALSSSPGWRFSGVLPGFSSVGLFFFGPVAPQNHIESPLVALCPFGGLFLAPGGFLRFGRLLTHSDCPPSLRVPDVIPDDIGDVPSFADDGRGSGSNNGGRPGVSDNHARDSVLFQ